MHKITNSPTYQTISDWANYAQKKGIEIKNYVWLNVSNRLELDPTTKILLDPTESGEKKRLAIADAASITKFVSMGLGACFATALLVSAIALAAFPMTGMVSILCCVLGTILSHDLYQISANVETLMSGVGKLGNIGQRISCAWSNYKLANDLLKNTVAFEKLLRPWVQREIGHTLKLDRALFFIPIS